MLFFDKDLLLTAWAMNKLSSVIFVFVLLSWLKTKRKQKTKTVFCSRGLFYEKQKPKLSNYISDVSDLWSVIISNLTSYCSAGKKRTKSLLQSLSLHSSVLLQCHQHQTVWIIFSKFCWSETPELGSHLYCFSLQIIASIATFKAR